MSYNCDSVEEIVLNATMQANHVLALLKQEDEFPEIHFLQDMEVAALAARKEKDGKRLIPLPNFSWCSEGSGRSMDFLMDKVIPKIKGNIEAVFYWEGGDSVDGILVKDGKAVRCGVQQSLIKPEGW